MLGWLVRRARAHGFVPQISASEREALEAGSVWIEADLLSGRPDLARLLREPWPELTAEEQAFLVGPVDEVCGMVDEWTANRSKELPPEVLPFLRAHGFFGLAIPRAYGGQGFSPLALSAIMGRLASHSVGLSTLVVIPNSVGPAELLLAHGTTDQKDRYLPRLARGEDIPCFALTEAEAGSDAAAIRSEGIVFRDARGALMLRLTFRKRYITLAPIATLIGLATRLRDPGRLLGRGEDVGITVVLVPASTPGVEVGRHHDPMGLLLPNGPIEGRDVVVPLEQIIGGEALAGRGWGMLMQALAGGRGISLPAQSAAGIKAVARAVGAYAAVRRQFGLPIGRFEGVEEPLARLAGRAYVIEAARILTCGAVGGGRKPAVISALLKYQATEAARGAVADGMDVMAGAGLCLGPRNLVARGHLAAPIGITVEGANILTRTLIVYGQAVLRAHPFARREIAALEAADGGALARALVGHVGFLLTNLARSMWLDLTGGRLAPTPPGRVMARYHRRLARGSTRLAVLTDLALFTLGSRFKQRGKLAGRLADALAALYLTLCALRRFQAEGRREEDVPLARWAAEHSLAQAQTALDGTLGNLDVPVLGRLLRRPLALSWRLLPLSRPPSDRLGAQVARLLTTPGPSRDRLTAGIHRPRRSEHPLARLERAFALDAEAAPTLDRLRQAAREGRLPKGDPEALLEAALAGGLVDRREAALVRDAAAAGREVLEVDSFSAEELRGLASPAAEAAQRP